jgi:GxxExxY protein
MPYDDEIPPYGDLPEPPKELDELARVVIGAAIEVHKRLGAGLPEEAYVGALCVEFAERQIPFERQKRVEIFYKGSLVAHGRIDLLVGGVLVVEVKSCETLIAVHRKQIESYMRINKQPLGLLINFNVPLLKDGIKRVICS